MKRLTALLFVAHVTASAALAVPFGQWSEQEFRRLVPNQWSQSNSGVEVRSDRSVSLLWTRLPVSVANTNRASWKWSVSESVPATRLTQKGGDDRNLALYFVFLPPEQAQQSRNAGVRRMLGNRKARVLMYVWGGDHARGEILPSPYLGTRGKTVVLRPAGTGNHSETIDLETDFRRAFGEEKSILVGMAISSDSDDTGSSVRARLGEIRLE